MNRARAQAARAEPARRWHIPPPLVHGPEPLEGGAVLSEMGGPLGLLLWQALRDVLLWAETPPAERERLFAPGAAMERDRTMAVAAPDAALRAPLATLRALLESPEAMDSSAVAAACSGISRWASERGKLATALAWAQNAALAEPVAPEPVLTVARLAERVGDHARAELWYRRATGIARRARAWRIYARAFSGLGMLYQDRGNLPAAQRFHLRALRGARRGGLRPEQAIALHDLFGVAVEAGRPREAERYAREAFAAYPRRGPRLAALAHDVAYYWMEQGHFSRALAVFQAVAPLVEKPVERLWVEADLMRAAAGAGDEELASRMAQRVREKCGDPELATAAARARLELARGELQLGRWDAAEESAAEALRLGGAQREGRTTMTAEALLQAIRTGRAARGGPPARAPRPDGAPPAADEQLAAELIASLRDLSPAARDLDVLSRTESGMNHLQQPKAHAS